MKAKCKRLAGRTQVVGSTAFEFNADGICDVVLRGRGGVVEDFKNLCKLNGVSDISSGDQNEGAPAEAPVEPEKVVEPAKAVEPEAQAKEPAEKPRQNRRKAKKSKGDSK